MVALATGMTGIALEHLTTLVGPVIFLGIPMNAPVLLTWIAGQMLKDNFDLSLSLFPEIRGNDMGIQDSFVIGTDFLLGITQ